MISHLLKVFGVVLSVSLSVHSQVMVALVGTGGVLTAGESHMLSCQVTEGDTTVATMYRWFRDGSLISGQISATLSFSPLMESDSGDYHCEGTRGSSATSSGISIAVMEPSLSAVITTSGSTNEGQSYSLACAVSGDESLAVSDRIFQWDRVEGRIGRLSTLTFNPLLHADRGEYRCTVTITSPYLTGTRTVMGTVMITVNRVLPGPVGGLRVTGRTENTLAISWMTSGFIDRFEVAYNYTVNRCSAPQGAPRTDTISDDSMRSYTLRGLNEDSSYTITLRAINTAGSTMAMITADTSTSVPRGIPESISFHDVNLTNITVQWTELPCSDRNGEITDYTVEYRSTTPPHSNTVTVSGSNNTTLVVGGLLPRTSYTFSVRAQGATNARSGTMFTATPTGVGFFLNGTFLPNNSVVLLECSAVHLKQLIVVGGISLLAVVVCMGASTTADIYSSKGFSSILLNRRRGVGPTGVYTCVIPDGRNTINNLFINITESLPPPMLSYNRTTNSLTCVSNGVPVESVTWTRNGAVISSTSSSYRLEQSLVDTMYHSILTVTSSNIDDYIGTFSCRVNIGRGSILSQSLNVNGISITGNEVVHQVRSSVSISCSSDLVVQQFRWLSNGREISASSSGQQQFPLVIVVDTLELANTTYTCEVQAVLAIGFGAVGMDTIFRINGTVPARLPSSVNQTLVTSSSATIVWELSEIFVRSTPEIFTILYRKNGADLDIRSVELTATSSQTYSSNLDSLDPGSVYSYKIESRNDFETIFTPRDYSFKTLDAMSTPITELQLRTPNETTFVITWQPPANPNGDVIHYFVSITNLKDDSEVEEDNTVSTSFTQSNLVSGVPYRVNIAAVNGAGVGELTTFVNFSQELKPSKAPIGVNATRTSAIVIMVKWIPLTLSEARGFISHYTVTYFPQRSGRKRQSSETLSKRVPGMDSNTTTIEDLDPDTEYGVTVSATNGAETSNQSTTAMVSLFVGPGDVGEPGGAMVSVGVLIGAIIGIILLAAVINVATNITLLMYQKRRTKAEQPSEAHTLYDTAGGANPCVVEKGVDQVYSEIVTPPVATGGKRKEGFSMSECAAYETTQGGEVKQAGLYEVVESVNQM